MAGEDRVSREYSNERPTLRIVAADERGRLIMRIVIPGGTGQVGSLLARTFHDEGHDVVVLSRAPRPRPWREVAWDGATVAGWTSEIDGCDVVINLAGRSVMCRYDEAHKREIIESRVQSTREVGEAIAAAKRPPRVWLQASTATIYAHRYDGANDERSGVLGGSESNAPAAWRFSIEVARAWERTFTLFQLEHTRQVALRSAMILSPDAGGIFETLVGLVRRGLGGAAADGRQYMSWIHEHDFVAAVRWLIARPEIDGVVNVASPHPLPNAEFMRILRDACGVPCGLPATKWMLEIGALLMRTETELILKSRRVVPTRLVESGFRFQYPQVADAVRELYARRDHQRRMPRQAA